MEEKKYLTVEEVRDAKDLTERDMEVPEWGGTIRIKGITVEERDEVVQASRTRDNQGKETLRLINMQIETLRIAIKSPLFTRQTLHILRKKAAGVVQKVYDEIEKTSSFEPDKMAVEADPSRQDSEKESEAGKND